MKIIDKIKYRAEKFPDGKSLNSLSWSELWDKIASRPSREKALISSVNPKDVVIDILAAELQEKPVIVSANRSEAEEFANSQREAKFFSEFSLVLKTSGSSGEAKFIKQPAGMIYSNLQNALKLQNLTEEDRILTVSSLFHAGGLHVQTLPGLYAGAVVDIHKFTPSVLNRKPWTVTHLIPRQAELLIRAFRQNKTHFKSYRLIVCGSDIVPGEVVDFFINQVDEFIVNYGMTEAGPIIINHSFKSGGDLDKIYRRENQSHFLGTNCWCDYKIVDGELRLSGENICTNGFLRTGDRVKRIHDKFYFNGRIEG